MRAHSTHERITQSRVMGEATNLCGRPVSGFFIRDLIGNLTTGHAHRNIRNLRK